MAQVSSCRGLSSSIECYSLTVDKTAFSNL
nr:MAG TPA: hypothetical protein [Caudoviricetes sp.]